MYINPRNLWGQTFYSLTPSLQILQLFVSTTSYYSMHMHIAKMLETTIVISGTYDLINILFV